MDADPAPPVRCPRCAASLRPGAPWCTLCYADLRPAERPAPALAATSGGAARARLDPLTVPLEQLLDPRPVPAEASWPCATCGQRNALEAGRCTACGNDFLSAVRGADGPLLVLPGVGDVLALSRAKRLALGAGVVLVCIMLTALLGVISG